METGVLDWLPRYARYRLRFSLPASARLPRHPGSAWRGAFGWALRELVCQTGQPECTGCVLKSQCLYQRIFETAVDEARSGVRTHAPHPFVLHVPPGGQPSTDANAWIEMTLIGEACDALPTVVEALRKAGEAGIAGRRNRLNLWSASQWHGGRWEPILRPEWETLRRLEPNPAAETPPCPGGNLRVRLLSPLRLKHQGRLVNESGLTPHVFLRALYARMHHLARYHAASAMAEWPEIPGQASFFRSRLRWHEIDRYS
ncbi:MAG: hypothetical protein D6791_12460 [Chloroflexi bacterium]|nr:MAG: hypothetical protein D6791_12460 [Chloroflexota bacterium]